MGGSTNLIKNLLSNIYNDFFDLKLIVLKYDWKDQVPPLEENLVSDTITIDTKFRGHYQRYLQFKKHIKNEPGLIVCSDTGELTALKFFRGLKKSIYFICHDDAYIETSIKFASIITVIITHNYSIYLTLKNRLPDANIHFIYHGVKSIEFDKKINYHESLKLTFLGRHTKNKGIYDLPIIDTLLRNKNIDVEWTILGDGPERTDFINLVKDKQNFHFSMPKSNDEVLEVLKGQDLLIHPSRNDGLPVAILEAMSAGCVPIVSAFNEGIKKVVCDSTNGYVVKVGDNYGFAEKIEFINQNRSLLADMSENNISKIRSEFNIKIQANKYFDLFKEFELFPQKKITQWDIFSYCYYRFISYVPRSFIKKVQYFKNKLC